MTAEFHTVRFERNTANNRWRARCSCGWARYGEREEVQTAAASHDLEQWVAADPTEPVPA